MSVFLSICARNVIVRSDQRGHIQLSQQSNEHHKLKQCKQFQDTLRAWRSEDFWWMYISRLGERGSVFDSEFRPFSHNKASLTLPYFVTNLVTRMMISTAFSTSAKLKMLIYIFKVFQVVMIRRCKLVKFY